VLKRLVFWHAVRKAMARHADGPIPMSMPYAANVDVFTVRLRSKEGDDSIYVEKIEEKKLLATTGSPDSR
jgi:hypothetical protein